MIDFGDIHLRRPRSEDGLSVNDLVAACPPLDGNSVYCNLLQCSHFAETCALAEGGGEVVGFVSGYRPPETPHVLFIWQVAVHADARGRGLAKALIREVLARPACASVTELHTTITGSNEASGRLFSSLAEDLRGPIRKTALFECERHFKGRHDTEILWRIGPFSIAEAAA